MERQGLIETGTGEYPLISLTPAGVQAMKQGTEEKLRWPALSSRDNPLKNPKRGGTATSAEEIATRELGWDEALFGKLKRLRSALAESEGKPAYLIFSNQTLEFLTRLQPTTTDAALKIRGIGQAKATTYLPEFLKLIRQHQGR